MISLSCLPFVILMKKFSFLTVPLLKDLKGSSLSMGIREGYSRNFKFY